ncbi:MAG TPA: ABC transporter ATP-binding protein [Ktedonobacteraceae bacterium]|nr:ABC transporter ATP-binding protein [Ktedonobacteraceae bacterium]
MNRQEIFILNAARMDQPVLIASHLRKDFPLRQVTLSGSRRVVQAVEDASLALYAGRATALVGESGSGKTTVARMLAGMYVPTRGEIMFEERPVKLRHGHEKSYLRKVQYIFQDPFSSLNPVHSIRYHLSRPLRVHGHAHSKREVEEQSLALLEKVSLTPARQFLDKYPHQLSGGQRQRVSIARALAVQPTVLLADEPVSMLDVSIRLDMLNLLLKLKEEEGLAFLFITHDIASARYFAEETQVMYAGQMVEGGPSDEVIRRPKHPYTRLLRSAAPDPDRMARVGEHGSTMATPERGEPPSLINPPSGCRFHLRCPHAMEVCRQKFPTRTDFGGGHWAHCFLYDQRGNN